MRRRDFLASLGMGAALGQIPRGDQALASEQPAGHTTAPAAEVSPGEMARQLKPRDQRVVWGRNGVVAATDPQAALAGIRMLLKGGNAVDAIVATSAALSVVEPYMSGMGGWGGFMLIYMTPQRKVLALDMMGTSPAAASIDTLTAGEANEGYKAPVVPANLAGWAEALKRCGTMSLGDVLEPAIELADGGSAVSKFDELVIAGSAKRLRKFPTTARIFLPDGRPPREGQVLKQPDLARTFRQVALHGPDIFYKGEIADEITAFLKTNGGLISKQDLAHVAVRWREPIQTTFHGYVLYSMPPGSCGMTMLQILNIMEGLDVKGMGLGSLDYVHYWLEAVKLAFLDDDRYNTGKDVEIPVARLISKEHAGQQRGKIRRDAAIAPGPTIGMEGTTHLAAADRWGNVVTLTESLVSGFGSGVVAGKTGVLLNNGHGLGFELDPKHVNALAAGQRPKGIMSPTIVMKGDKVVLGLGALGGYTIPQTVAQVLLSVLVFGMDIQEAIASPRMIYQGWGRVSPTKSAYAYLDPGFSDTVVAGLKARGHRLDQPRNVGAVQAVQVDPEGGALAGACDPRRDGVPVVW